MVEKAEEDFGGRIAEAQYWFRQAQDELKAAQGELANREVELALKLADVEKAQETAKKLADEAEAAQTQHEAALKTQEEDLATREEKLATMLHGKDEEVGKRVLQRTQELEQRHHEALNALAQAHADKVKELEEQALKLAQEKHTLNGALTVAQGKAISKAGELSEAKNSTSDLKLKLGEVEETLSGALTRQGLLNKELETEKQLLKNDTATLNDQKAGEKCWLGRLAAVANSNTNHLAIMGMPEMGYAPETSLSPNANLTIYLRRSSAP